MKRANTKASRLISTSLMMSHLWLRHSINARLLRGCRNHIRVESGRLKTRGSNFNTVSQREIRAKLAQIYRIECGSLNLISR